jgi:hypothetical protein
VCDAIAQFGVACETCDTGGEFCLELLVVDLEIPWVPGQTLDAQPECGP